MIDTGICTVDVLNSFCKKNLASTLGIEITDVGPDYVSGRMPVDERTVQPIGLLHGGASLALAETLGSIASNCCIDNNKYYCVGLEINGNHIRSVRKGYVYGQAKAVHIGKKTHVWEIRIQDEEEHLVCISRLTMAVIDR